MLLALVLVATFDIRFVACHIYGRFSNNETQIRTKRGTYNTKRQEHLDLVKEEFKSFDPYKLDSIWAIMLDNLRSMLTSSNVSDNVINQLKTPSMREAIR